MADTTRNIEGAKVAGIVEKLVDMGDGTFARKVVTSTVDTAITPGTGAANLGKAEDAPHTSGDVGVFLLAVQQALVASGLAGEGDYAGLQVDGFNLLKVGPDSLAIPSTSVTSAATIFTQDMTGYESISVQVTSAGSGCTITYETSDDNTNWVSTNGLNSASGSAGSTATNSTAVGLIRFPRTGRYFRARVSTYGSGTVTVVGNLHKNPQPLTNRVTVDGPTTNTGTISSVFPASFYARSTNPTANSNATAVLPLATLIGVPIVRPYSIPELDWQYAAASGGITDTADNVLVASAGAGIRNYLTRIDLVNTDATVGTEVVVKDGSTVIWRTFVPASLAAVSQPMPVSFTFPTPLKGSAATALNVACITTSSQTYVNAGGYSAP